MPVYRYGSDILGRRNRPKWLETTTVGYWEVDAGQRRHDRHHHDYNQLWLIARGKAKILVDGETHYVQAGDIVATRAGTEHDILETYGEETFAKFFLYEPTPVSEPGRIAHLARSLDEQPLHEVPNLPVPADFPPPFDHRSPQDPDVLRRISAAFDVDPDVDAYGRLLDTR
ncbi:cupin domain-containing protein [Phytohabitans kaempferiae]|uniref:Cupin domain-containing protein n=1 Tax=Phytohabitans kaempferiae TaxID=1620943 RepID=A0ABV6M780_9ACTN